MVTYDARQFGPLLVDEFEKRRSEIEETWGCPVIIEVPVIDGRPLEGTVRIRPKSPDLYHDSPPSGRHGFWWSVRFWCHVHFTVMRHRLARPFRALRPENLSVGRTLYVEPNSRLGAELIRQQKIAALPSLGKQWRSSGHGRQLVIEYEGDLLCVWNGDESEIQSLDEKMLKMAKHFKVSVDDYATNTIMMLPEFRATKDPQQAFEKMAISAAVWWILQQDTNDVKYPGRVRDHITPK
jgi:hypothetical protein